MFPTQSEPLSWSDTDICVTCRDHASNVHEPSSAGRWRPLNAKRHTGLRAHNGSEPLAPIASFLTGRWTVVRRIRDLRTRQAGRLRGAADFVPAHEGIGFTERGVLSFAQARMEACRDYRFVVESEDRFLVFFADGRFFHEAHVSGGIACVAHDCPPDAYRGRYRFPLPDRWSLSWRITGPRKDLVISTVFSRPGAR